MNTNYKLKILGRTNLENKVYLKIRAEKSCMKIISELALEFDKSFFFDDMISTGPLVPYKKWKDVWANPSSKNFGADIICGDKVVHLIIWKFPNFEKLNKILDKYFEFDSLDKFYTNKK
jgi:hypothetical protein